MDEPKTKQEKRNTMTIKITSGAGSVGGIGGIVFLGGALLAATLVSAFAFNRRTSSLKRKKTEQSKSSVPPPNDVTVHQTPAPEEDVTDLSNDLEMMMKSSKDNHNHNQIMKGLNFLLPKNTSIDAVAETGVTWNEPAQLLILEDEKAKIEVSNDTGYKETVLSEIHDENISMFDDSGITITKEEHSFLVSEVSRLEQLNKNIDSLVGFDKETAVCSDGLVLESDGYHSLGVKSRPSLPLVDSPLHSEAENIDDDKDSLTEKLQVEAVELLEEGCEVKRLSPLLDSVLLSESESGNEDKLLDENPPVSVEAVELLEEKENCERKSSLPLGFGSESGNEDKLLDENPPVAVEAVELLEEEKEECERKSSLPLGFGSESVHKDGFSTESFPVLIEADGLQAEECERKRTVPLGFKFESMNQDNLSSKSFPVLVEAVGLQAEDNEMNRLLPLLASRAETESIDMDTISTRKPPVLDKAFKLLEEDKANNSGTGFREHIEVENEVDACDAMELETVVEDLVHEIAKEDQVTDDENEGFEKYIEENFIVEPLVEAVEVNKEGETFVLACDTVDPQVEVVEVNKEGETFGLACDTVEPLVEAVEGNKEGDTFVLACDIVEPLVEVVEVNKEGETFVLACDTVEPNVPLIGELEEVKNVEENGNEIVEPIGKGVKDDDFEETTIAEEFKETSTELLLDQVPEEEEELVEVTEYEETASNYVQDELGMTHLTQEGHELLEEAMETVCLDPIKVEDDEEMKLIKEDTEECNNVDVLEEKEVLQSLEDSEKEEYSENINENEPMETVEVVKVAKSSYQNGEKDNSSCNLILAREFSDDEPPIQPTEEATTVEHICEKTPQVESSIDDEESEYDDEESSEGTEELSNESNCDAIWPTESIEELLSKADDEMKTDNYQTVRDGNINDDSIGHKIDETVEVIDKRMANERGVKGWKVKKWIMAIIIWCLCHWYFGLPFVQFPLITLVIFIGVLFGIPNNVLAKGK